MEKIFISCLQLLLLSLSRRSSRKRRNQRLFDPLEVVVTLAGDFDADMDVDVLDLIQVILSFLGLIALSFVIWGGYLYLTSAGNEEQVGKAKKTLTYAIIGIVTVLLSYVIVSFVFDTAVDVAKPYEAYG